MKVFLREGEVLNDENNRLLEKVQRKIEIIIFMFQMNELKADYELASNAFLDDLKVSSSTRFYIIIIKQNSSFIRSLRDKLRAIQEQAHF